MTPELVRKKRSERFYPFAGMNMSSLFRGIFLNNQENESVWNGTIEKSQTGDSTTRDRYLFSDNLDQGARKELHSDERAGLTLSANLCRKAAVKKNELNELAVIGTAVSSKLKKRACLFGRAGHETSPLFEEIGQDLQSVFHETKALTETVKNFAQRLNSDGEENSSLESAKQLIVDVAQNLHRDHQDIENDLQHIGSLRHSLAKVRSMYEIVDTVSSTFRAIRINIQIQCNTNAISDDLFKGLVEDITSLSQQMDRITIQISKDLFASERNISTLNNTVSENLGKIKQVSELAETGISNAFIEIAQLVEGTVVMMKETGIKSRAITSKVGEVVVSLQFHDSMSQRLEAIGRGIDNVCLLLIDGGEKTTPGHLGTAFQILDVHFRQLEQLVSELSSVRRSIEQSFEDLGEEVSKLSSAVQSLQCKGIGQKNFNSHSSSLQQDLSLLFELFSQGRQMKEEIHSSAVETQGISSRLDLFAEEMQVIQSETKLQAINTIIMACSLGEKGKTIEVLAKEISTLSDKTSLLTNDVTAIQGTMNSLLVKLTHSSADEQGEASLVDHLMKELEQFRGVYDEIDDNVGEFSQQVKNTSEKIRLVRKNLSFLEELEEQLISFSVMVKIERDKLKPWQGEELSDSSKSIWQKEEYASVLEEAIWIDDNVASVHNSHSEKNALLFDEEITVNKEDLLLGVIDESDRENNEIDNLENVEFF